MTLIDSEHQLFIVVLACKTGLSHTVGNNLDPSLTIFHLLAQESSSSSSPPQLEREVEIELDLHNTHSNGDAADSNIDDTDDPPLPRKHLREWNVSKQTEWKK